MPYTLDKKDDLMVFNIKGFFAAEDIKEIINIFDQMIKEDKKKKFLLDFSEDIEYNEQAVKMAYQRLNKGFPKDVKISLVLAKKGKLNQILSMISYTMPQNTKFFENVTDAENWLNS